MAVPEDPPAGGPDWILTYGDMMSLLLTFFIMLVSLSELKGDQKYQAIVEAVMQHLGYRAAPAGPSEPGYTLGGIIEKLKSLGAFTNTDKGTGGVKTAGAEGNELRVFRGREGTSIHAGNALIFESGSATLSPEADEVLKAIAQTLAGKPNKVDVRGHTSSAPLPEGSPFADRTQLSYERARHVAERLTTHGIQPERLRISALADTEPLPSTADKRSLRPDRVEIFVLDAYTREFIGPRDVPE